jgi:hypothetical protein
MNGRRQITRALGCSVGGFGWQPDKKDEDVVISQLLCATIAALRCTHSLTTKEIMI